MTDVSYADPSLVALYDELNGWSCGRDFYVSLLPKPPARVLDVGCGTGMLAVAISRMGHDVVGIDPARAMLDVAAHRKGGDAIDWHCSTLQDFRPEDCFDLIFMTGHAFQCLLDDDDILVAFRSVAELLKPDGQFVFETRNPSVHPWLKWNPEDSRRTGTAPDGQPYETFHKVLCADGRLITFETTFRIGHKRRRLLSESTLRFCELQEMIQLARHASLQLDRCWGDWDRTALSERSPEIIVSLKL